VFMGEESSSSFILAPERASRSRASRRRHLNSSCRVCSIRAGSTEDGAERDRALQPSLRPGSCIKTGDVEISDTMKAAWLWTQGLRPVTVRAQGRGPVEGRNRRDGGDPIWSLPARRGPLVVPIVSALNLTERATPIPHLLATRPRTRRATSGSQGGCGIGLLRVAARGTMSGEHSHLSERRSRC
jgi:hypothetical protein